MKKRVVKKRFVEKMLMRKFHKNVVKFVRNQ